MDIGDKMFNVMKDICNTLKEMSKQMSNIEDHLAKKNSGFSTDNSTEDNSTRKRKRKNQEEQKKRKVVIKTNLHVVIRITFFLITSIMQE